ncbi:N-acylneuraminate cytidylyltransferase [Lacrimispora sp. BS-2]|uniref:N-acylneuraminate cytidylyltransferase n=1 Tax=Lacrimispora sp. BS-2 TaxID=3151850 RepID=A0AAU7PPH9_9FIRM
MNAAYIPVRGGSKSIPLKNVKIIAGKPLVYWTVVASCGCEYIDKVYVATDSNAIGAVVESFSDEGFIGCEKIEVIDRSKETASDTASTELAMLEFADNYTFDNIVLVQATSPLLTSADLNRGFDTFYEKDVDSVISVVRQKRFHWSIDNDGFAYPTNYDVYSRPRRQDFDGYLMENGAFYITSKANLLKSRNRVSGLIKAVEMNVDSAFEIDEESDWVIVESLMEKSGIVAKGKLQHLKMFLTDCDGCLTDGGMYYSENGDELKKFNTRDGYGLSLLKKHGIIRGIVTSENVSLNQRRAEKLQLEVYEAGCLNKLEIIQKLCDQYNISMNEVAYVGDDLNDLEVIKAVGLGCCPADAHDEIRKAANYISPIKGGYGAIRDIIEYILRTGW